MILAGLAGLASFGLSTLGTIIAISMSHRMSIVSAIEALWASARLLSVNPLTALLLAPLLESFIPLAGALVYYWGSSRSTFVRGILSVAVVVTGALLLHGWTPWATGPALGFVVLGIVAVYGRQRAGWIGAFVGVVFAHIVWNAAALCAVIFAQNS